MNKSGLKKLFCGFIFIMISFRIQGFDILPDIIGYLFLALGFSELIPSSTYFKIASKYNVTMVLLSIFSIYQKPVQEEGIHLGILGILSIPVAIASFVLNLLVIYNLFMGIKDMANKRGEFDLVKESAERWNQYKMLQVAVLFSLIVILIPPLGLIYITVFFIISIILTIGILGFLVKCINSVA